jgi:hypothetical protein
VANADNNCVAVIDIEACRRSGVKGFILTGWCPTSVAVTPDGKNLPVGVGQGLDRHPDESGRPLPARVRHLIPDREPHLRPGVRRPDARQR